MPDGAQSPRAQLNPTALAVEEAALVLTRVGGQTVIEAMIREALEKGAQVTLCGTCCQARGLGEDELVEGALIGTIHDLAEVVRRSDKVLMF